MTQSYNITVIYKNSWTHSQPLSLNCSLYIHCKTVSNMLITSILKQQKLYDFKLFSLEKNSPLTTAFTLACNYILLKAKYSARMQK